MTLEDLRQQRLARQQAGALARWREIVQRMGVTAIVVQHPDFVWQWDHNPQARRWGWSCPEEPWVHIAKRPNLDAASMQETMDDWRGVEGVTTCPWLELDLGVPVYSAWYLLPSDPCWEGHTRIWPNDPELPKIRENFPELLAAAQRLT